VLDEQMGLANRRFDTGFQDGIVEMREHRIHLDALVRWLPKSAGISGKLSSPYAHPGGDATEIASATA
jgi:hypothetical protein